MERRILDFGVNDTFESVAERDDVVGYYRSNEKRMQYRTFRSHVLQVRMKRAGQRWGMVRARRMVRLRAVYRTAGAVRFHWAIREALNAPAARHKNQLLPNAPRRAKHSYTPSRFSSRNRAAAASK